MVRNLQHAVNHCSSNVQAFVDVRNCDYSNLNLKTKVFSGVLMRGANFENSTFVGDEFARADAKGANFMNADMTDINGYSANFDGLSKKSLLPPCHRYLSEEDPCHNHACDY